MNVVVYVWWWQQTLFGSVPTLMNWSHLSHLRHKYLHSHLIPRLIHGHRKRLLRNGWPNCVSLTDSVHITAQNHHTVQNTFEYKDRNCLTTRTITLLLCRSKCHCSESSVSTRVTRSISCHSTGILPCPFFYVCDVPVLCLSTTDKILCIHLFSTGAP